MNTHGIGFGWINLSDARYLHRAGNCKLSNQIYKPIQVHSAILFMEQLLNALGIIEFCALF